MAIHVGIEHVTRYRYDRPVVHAPHLVRLRPAPHTRTTIHDYALTIRPESHRVYWQEDPFGNLVARVVFTAPIRELVIDVRLVAEMTVIDPFDFFVEKYAEEWPFKYDGLLAEQLAPYFECVEDGPRLRAWVDKVDRRPQKIVPFLVGLNARLQRDIAYTVRMDPGVATCETTLEKALGSCRDTGWLLVQALRRLGLAARFASGYLVQLTADVKSLDGPSGPEKDFTDLHAWAEVYLPGAGWVGLDPTSGLFAGEGHIPLACTPDPVSAAPITGAIEPCEVAFEHANVVRRVHEDPRVTRPYDDAQWTAIRALGEAVDRDLGAFDVRLTMGGEPTFVSIDDVEGAEWTTEALGLHKRERAGDLVRRLKSEFAPSGLVHMAQGKWYPGEPLPRWALGCHWRTDGRALWRDDALLADETRDYGHDAAAARRFGLRLAERLGIASAPLVAAREDWLHYAWREACRPVDRDPIAIEWAPQVPDDCSRVLARGLDRVVGWVLPLSWRWSAGGWHSAPWPFDTITLAPGSSPMGLRLPIDRLPQSALVEVEEELAEPPPSWTAAPAALRPPEDPSPRAPRRRRRWTDVPYTALCLEPRDGRLHVFMPPIGDLDAYGVLLSTVEATAADLAMPIVLEGVEPPAGPGLRTIRVTPDPGVIEVNVHPAGSWAELESTTTALYEAARLARLGTEKFLMDGRHTGTGGGNHVTLGGATPFDSPFLRRPDLLRSLVTYWQHHPALSYLFAGLFIGPTSQAPRVDEGGTAPLAELGQSLAEVERAWAPWVVDRALRAFLADPVGNTHRAEFSIDKLWSGDSASGRQGLVELRAFEMPPHARMSLVQMLLLRALVARFWKEPYRHQPAAWGGALHGRFLLPHYVWVDVCGVAEELAHAGYPFDADWLLPFFEFRFPVCGRAAYDGVQLELRMALEPWLVLGEDATAPRQSRVVDSTVERVQLTCRGLDPARHLVTCNGRRLPLAPTGEPGTWVAGVRYKAWSGWYALHPTIAAHAPLVFDVVDRRLGRAIGGCVHHVSHPGGRAYAGNPVNAFEAEARRISRFWAWGHTAGDVPPPAWLASLRRAFAPAADGSYEPPAERPLADQPHTLDLRRMAPA
jgi:uncharacterized protein (DUF2126 family)/transglutaminase-like putative cysteine protease